MFGMCSVILSCSVEHVTNVPPLWFSLIVKIMFRSGEKIKFWHDKWLGSPSLKDYFSRFCLTSEDKDHFITDMVSGKRRFGIGNGREGLNCLCGRKTFK